MCLPERMCATYMQSLQNPEGETRSLRAGVSDGCEWPSDAENRGLYRASALFCWAICLDSVLKCPTGFILGIACSVSALLLPYWYLLNVSGSEYLNSLSSVLTIVWFSWRLRLTEVSLWKGWEQRFCSRPPTLELLSLRWLGPWGLHV